MNKDSLIIEGNAVYEMDMDCYVKRMKLERQEKKLPVKDMAQNNPTISIRNVDEEEGERQENMRWF